ncbi:MAG: hypothetical protein ACUVUR_01265 [bacterium]
MEPNSSVGGATVTKTGPIVGIVWKPAKIGPKFDWLDHDNIRIAEGGLAGREFRVKTEIAHKSATVSLYDREQQIGNVSIERNPPGKGVILWDAGVREAYRQNGLAAIMTWIIFRELLTMQSSATFRIRMLRSLKAGENGTQLQNIGMGVIAVRLGFTPELNLERIFARDNVTDINFIPATNGMPAGVRIELRTDPLVITAFVLNPDKLKPTGDVRTYIEIKEDINLIHDWARLGLLVINGNYKLREPQINHFVNRIAVDEKEAVVFRNKIRGL